MAREEAREAALRHADAALGQSRKQLMQIDPGLRLVEGQDQASMKLDPMRPLIAGDRLGRNLAVISKLPAPTALACKIAPPKGSAALWRDAAASTAQTTRTCRSTDKAEEIGAILRRQTILQPAVSPRSDGALRAV